jgi:hypothetical protein
LIILKRGFVMAKQTSRAPATSSKPLAAPDRRVAVRYSCTVKSLCQTKTAKPEDFWFWGRIQDISAGGIALRIRRPFEVGTQLLIEPLNGLEGYEPLHVRVIRATRQARGGWLLGCEFANQPAGQSVALAQALPALRQVSDPDDFDLD